MSNSMENTEIYSNKDYDTFEKEWEKAREVLSFFDDKLHDLRKYGFSFLTVLLTGESFLVPLKLPDLVLLGVFTITLLLICTLHLIDKNYVSFQEAAYSRAMVLERRLNMELSEMIATRYTTDGISRHVIYIYELIILGVIAFGCFTFAEKTIYAPILAAMAVIAGGYIVWHNTRSKFYRHYPSDWIITPLLCSKTQPVTVMISNLNDKITRVSKKAPHLSDMVDVQDGLVDPIVFLKNDIILEIINQTDFKAKPVFAKEDIVFYDSYSIVLKREHFGEPGLYKIRPKNRYIPLARTIVVS
ncbi:MAG: hypothetical protein ACYDG5_08320 [Dehalococcoidales bacterium]